MGDILLYYRRPDPTTWVYLSSFLTIGLFFVFHRFWSIRNLDLLLLILLAPGLLIVHEGYRRQIAEAELTQTEAAPQPKGQASASPTLTPTRPDDFSVSHWVTRQWMRLGSPAMVLLPEDETALAGAVPGDTGVTNEATVANRVNRAESETSEENSADPNTADPNTVADAAAIDAATIDTEQTWNIQRFGFLYLFAIEALILLRLILDPLMVRRPLLNPNLTSGGLTFIGISMFVFMMANVVNSNSRIQTTQGPALGPGYALMNMLPAIPTRPVSDSPGGVSPISLTELTTSQQQLTRVAKSLAIIAQLLIVMGIVLIGNRHFNNMRVGVGCATLYLLLPYTAQMTGRVDHVVPAALLLWAILCYRRPLIAGIFMGLACGLVYYPLFLLPLWFSFYWQRGARSFAIGIALVLAILVIALSLDQSASLFEHLRRMFGVLNPNRDASELRGFWALGLDPIWRLPVIVAFLILCAFFFIWPSQKNLANLISSSAATMVAAQFWHGYGGGLYMAWFLPLLLLTFFRPNLQDRIATKVVAIDRRLRKSNPEASLVE